MLIHEALKNLGTTSPALLERLGYDQLCGFIEATRKLLPMIVLQSSRHNTRDNLPPLPSNVAQTLSTYVKLPLCDIQSMWLALGTAMLRDSALPDVTPSGLSQIAAHYRMGKQALLVPSHCLSEMHRLIYLQLMFIRCPSHGCRIHGVHYPNMRQIW